jgi:hypothetical protein
LTTLGLNQGTAGLKDHIPFVMAVLDTAIYRGTVLVQMAGSSPAMTGEWRFIPFI